MIDDERRQSRALLLALLNMVVWAAWFAASSRLGAMEALGPSLFWVLPVVGAGIVWSSVFSRVGRTLPLRRRVGGTVAGLLATAVGIPLAVITGVVLAFAAFGPMFFIALVLEGIVLFGGLGAIYGLCRLALGALEEPSWTP